MNSWSCRRKDLKRKSLASLALKSALRQEQYAKADDHAGA
jgi:alkylhydroperoxidase/carboxymuconolactone decarboxylase family protein YurZ